MKIPKANGGKAKRHNPKKIQRKMRRKQRRYNRTCP